MYLVLGLVFTGFYMVQSDIDTSNRKMKKKIVRLEKILAQKSKIEREKALVDNLNEKRDMKLKNFRLIN